MNAEFHPPAPQHGGPALDAAPAWQARIDVLIIVLALIAAVTLGGMLWARAHYPSLGLLAEPGEGGWRITSVSRATAQQGVPQEWLGTTLTRACRPNMPEQCVALRPEWMRDTPISLPSASAIAEFVRGQQALLELAGQSGQQLILHARPGAAKASTPDLTATMMLQDSREFLTERYAIVLFAAIMIYTVGCAMLAFVRRTQEVWLAFAMCAGFSLFMLMRSWYTDRSWGQPSQTWWLVISLFRLGVMVCAVSTIMTLWNMRLHQLKTWSPLAFCLALCAVIVLHAMGWIDSATWGYRYVTFVFAILILVIALASWWHARHAGDGQRLRSKTFGQILLVGYLPAMVSIPLWTFRPDLPQIAFIQNLAIGVVGIPIVIMVSQSAQYQLHAFWWRLWLVLVAVVFALVGASILILLSGFSAAASLGIMMAFAALSVYALRGWLEKRLVGKPPAIEQFLPQLMALQGLQNEALEQGWHNLLREVFSPQQITESWVDTKRVSLDAMGDSLLIPALGSVGALTLTGAGSFTRSFGRADERLASSLHALALQGLQARASFVAGAVQERKRIAADLHDDIGGKLLHLANSGGAEGQYARNTLEDLRTITRGLSSQPRALPELIADLQYQLSQRAERSGIELMFDTQLPHGEVVVQIGSRQSTVLASICSELLRNAMQHPGISTVSFAVQLQDGMLRLECESDGDPTDPTLWKSGLGTTSIRRRVYDLQGQCNWTARQGIGESGVKFQASWPLASWLSADTGAFMAGDLT